MKIDSLTEEQEQKLIEFRQEWLEIGLCTDPIDKEKTSDAISRAYRLINKDAPYMWYVDSPMMAQLVLNVLHKNSFGEPLSNNLGVNLGVNLRANLGDNLGDNLGVNLRANLGANLWDNLGVNLRANLGDNLGANLWDNLRANLGANLWDNLGANLRANLGANLRANLGDNLGANLRANLWNNLGANLRANLWDNLGANLRANLWDNLGDNLGANLRANLEHYGTDFWGSLDSYWVSFYLFPHEHIKAIHSKEEMQKLNIIVDLAKSCFWIYPYENICFVSDRPSVIHRDAEGRLHHEKEMAIQFRDGWGLTSWHGTTIPDDWLRGGITPEIALKWENIEQRRCACEIVGWNNILSQLNPKTIDKDDDPEIGELVEVDLPDSGKERFLRVRCGTGRDFALAVDPSCQTALAANLWTYGLEEDHSFIPEIRT